MVHPVEEVIAAEKEAEKILKKAEERKAEIIDKARHETLAILGERQKKMDAEQEAIIRKKSDELERKKEKIRADGQGKVAQIERLAQGNMVKAIESLLKEFEKQLD